MSYICRLYFRKDTGHLLYWYEYETVSDSTPIPTVEQDIASIKPLCDFIPENIKVVEIEQDDLLTRQKVRKARGIVYDPIAEELVFDIDSGTLAEIERRVFLENRIDELETTVNNLLFELQQKVGRDETEELEQVVADIAELLLEVKLDG